MSIFVVPIRVFHNICWFRFFVRRALFLGCFLFYVKKINYICKAKLIL